MRSLPALSLATLGVALLTAGCGGGQRRAVAQYIDRVNVVENQLASPLGLITRAAARVGGATQPGATGSLAPADLHRQMTESEQRVNSLASQLAAIDAPPDARHLRALLLKLIREQKELAHEAVLLIDFLPRYRKALADLDAATRRLQRGFTAATKLATASKARAGTTAKKRDQTAALTAQAAGFARYHSDLTRIIRQVRELHPPPLARPGYKAQLVTLERTAGSAAALAREIEQRRLSGFPTLLTRFVAASVANQSTAAQRAQIAAFRSYDNRVQNLDSLATQIQKEQNRLQTAVH